ncbi:putative nucleoside kinase, CMP and AMP kinase [Caldisphaera lagunensis DSM 15908]|uniref:Putative adenylate kinase n=1 Tax=Caldisphaera lagunensis (strain DSM 15908 / JCM 11604 / ANMR 0165 / IC-154) TaxID=1056495 RepID=L0AD49_CALLD|nr:putative nucleoside kinase, CMP and AMP kinase [Caldisphaera lagunensis DSM 15908]
MNEEGFIFISGTPGTGKSTLAKLISEELNCNYIEVSDFAVKKNLVIPDETGRDTYVIKEDELKEEILKEKGKGLTILVTHYPDVFLDDDRFYLNTLFLILLRTNPKILMDRLNKKGWDEKKVKENVLAEAFNTIAEDIYDYKDIVIEIDTSNENPNNLLDIVFNKINTLDFGIRINWLLNETLIDFISSLVDDVNFNNDRISD